MAGPDSFTPSEMTTLSATIDKLVDNIGDSYFKIGRCAAKDFAGLGSRDEYSEALRIDSVFVGSAGKVELLERELIKWSWEHFQFKCVNEQEGGGGQSAADPHTVYWVTLPNTAANKLRALTASLMALTSK